MKDEYIEDDMTLEEFEIFKEKFCHDTFKATVLTEEEITQLKREGRI